MKDGRERPQCGRGAGRVRSGVLVASAAWVLTAGASAASAATVGNFSTVAPGFSASGSRIAANSIAVFAADPRALAVPFAFTTDIQLMQVRVPIRTYNTFPGNVLLELREVVGGTPTGPLLESWTLTSLMTQVTSAAASLQTLTSVLSPVLQASKTYALVAVPQTGVLVQWYENITGAVGNFSQNPTTLAWSFAPSQTQLAFEVTGRNAIPIPSAWMMGSVLLVGLLSRRAVLR